MKMIAKNSVVSLRYVMKNSSGAVLEDTMEAAPVTYLHGGTGIHALLQTQLEGLEEGDKKMVLLQKEAGLADDFTFEVVIDAVRLALPEEVMLGYPVLQPAELCDADCTCHKE